MGAYLHGYRRLKAGNLELLYQQGQIRQVCYGNTQVLNSVYTALRDQNWRTIPFTVHDEQIEKNNDLINIRLSQHFQHGQIRYQVHISITIRQEELHYSIKGTALNGFLKNRIGLCVLHPVAGCRGKAVQIFHTGGKTSTGIFPEQISPDQPFLDVAAMQWIPSPGINARLDLIGDVFETEDQRNWTDASYKTYSTPLSLPFPAEVKAGDEIKQSVVLHIDIEKNVRIARQEIKKSLGVNPMQQAGLPEIGCLLNPEDQRLDMKEAGQLNHIGLSHIRIDLRLREPGWIRLYQQAFEMAGHHGCPFQLALHFSGKHLNELGSFLDRFRSHPLPLKSMLIFDETRLSPRELLGAVVPVLRPHLPGIPIGGGTDAYFAELNRNMPGHGLLDFISYSVCPQVHASDDMTLLENAAIQGDTVRSARERALLPVHIGAVSLRQRFNAVATEKQEAYPEIDGRQHSDLAAGWTLVSLRELALAGAESVNYFEHAGPRGLIKRRGDPGTGKSPLPELFSEVLKAPDDRVLGTTSTHPLEFDALVMQNSRRTKMMLVNHTSTRLSIAVTGLKNIPSGLELMPGLQILNRQT